MDARRRQYVPLSVHFADGSTGSRILERFGVEGLGVWACLLAAAKKSATQGTFSYSSEPDAWTKLGMYGHEPAFSFTDFVTLLGRLKQARREKRGRVVDVVLTHWGDWNQTIRRETEAEKKRRKRAQNTGDNTTPLGGTEGEGEGESPKSLPGSRANGTNPRSRGTNPRATGTSPRQRGTNPRAATNGDAPPTIPCPHCGVLRYTQRQLTEHLENVHPATVTAGVDADIPF